MKRQDQLNHVNDRRPRIAIVGGGGAMGRLFAQLLHGVVRELYLFDYFGPDPKAANLMLTLEDLRKVGARAGRVSRQFGVSRAATDQMDPTNPLWVQESFGSETNRAILVLDQERPDDDFGYTGGSSKSLAELVERVSGAQPRGCVVFAGLPSDASSLLSRADLILLAIGFDNRAAYSVAMTSYLPWLRPGSLVVDLGSTKTGPMDVLTREVPFDVGILGAHALFGPTVTDVTGLIVAVVDAEDGRPESLWRRWFLEELARLRMIVTSTSAADHDDAMAFVQGLTHFALLSFAYTFVRVDRDPADLLLYRTPVFEPLLYLAARVAYLARNNSDTYRSIQALSTRPEVRREFLAAARDLLAAIEQVSDPSPTRTDSSSDPLTAIFRQFGGPWSPENRDRRGRQRREHFLEMGVHLVDNLNKLRQDIVASVGQVRAIEEKHAGLPPRIVVGVVDVDLLDPGKYDVATQIRLRRLNLSLGSIRGARRDANRPSPDEGRDDLIPLSRARILTDSELLEWLFQNGQLVKQRLFRLLVPEWFDQLVVTRLIKGLTAGDQGGGSQVWHVDINDVASRGPMPDGFKLAVVSATIVIHPAELVAVRAQLQLDDQRLTTSILDRIDRELAEVRGQIEPPEVKTERRALAARKDQLKHERKALMDRRTAEIDREVRQATRNRVQDIADATLAWLTSHGCTAVSWVGELSATDRPPVVGLTEQSGDGD